MLLGMLRGYHRAQCLMKICKTECAAVSSLVLYCLKINPHLSVLLEAENNNPINISVFLSVCFSISKSMEVSSQSGHVLNGQLSPADEGMMKWMCSVWTALQCCVRACAGACVYDSCLMPGWWRIHSEIPLESPLIVFVVGERGEQVHKWGMEIKSGEPHSVT